MKVLPNPPAGGDADETRLAEDARGAHTGVASVRSPTDPHHSDGWLSSSGAIDHGRFPPGTILGGRYRIVGKLGKGGMGEVYRADDLKLGQAVALKFLPPEVDRDPVRLTQLHTEVRMARQVSHPNVCRVYDIDEVDGHTFLSMEYVDGEDLASLLRRIGRFNEERGLEVARQICAGLAAAHERGVIHRDLKPANVMLDATGHVRITDFGLAGVAGETIRAGTPAYMAPEQIGGGEVDSRSDIYALGLVLYEIFTGKRAVEATNLAELIRRREHGEIVAPSALARDLSPEVDRAVMRCLAADPASRPSSALIVSAALPGGNPLAAALAAGETPSPEMVAAAGEKGALDTRWGVALVAITLLGLIAAAFVAQRTLLVNRIVLAKSADVLEERGREIVALAGYTEPPADTARGIAVNNEYIRWVETTNRSASKWDHLGDGTAPLMDFWYRTSPRPLTPLSPEWTPQWNDPPLTTSGMVSVVVDDRGRLVEFVAMPPQFDPSSKGNPPFEWTSMFQAAGLDRRAFSDAAPQWTPRIYGERREAWEGPMPQRPDVKLRVEAASYGGRPVAFKVVGPWTRPASMDRTVASATSRAVSAAGTLIVLMLLAGALLLVRANLKSGRADRRGAGRIALFLLGVWMLSWALAARHSLDVQQETSRLFTALAFFLLNVGFTWIFYLALEPFVRRLSPDILIGWTRLLSGQFRDPRVGRDLLVGLMTGVVFSLVTMTDLSIFTGGSPTPVALVNMSYFVGDRFVIANLLAMLPNALQSAMLGTFMYVLLLGIVRRRWIAATLVVLFVCAVVIAEGDGGNPWVVAALALALGVSVVFVFLRYGLLAVASTLYVNQILHVVPLTTDPSQPHAAIGAFAMLAVAALALYAFSVTGAGERLFRRLVPA
jgi:serine/threonine-protein kinase